MTSGNAPSRAIWARGHSRAVRSSLLFGDDPLLGGAKGSTQTSIRLGWVKQSGEENRAVTLGEGQLPICRRCGFHLDSLSLLPPGASAKLFPLNVPPPLRGNAASAERPFAKAQRLLSSLHHARDSVSCESMRGLSRGYIRGCCMDRHHCGSSLFASRLRKMFRPDGSTK